VQPPTGILKLQTSLLRIALRHQIEPEMGIEVQVKQGAVHIQQHGIYGLPIKHNQGTL
jgi:hypothetical protein